MRRTSHTSTAASREQSRGFVCRNAQPQAGSPPLDAVLLLSTAKHGLVLKRSTGSTSAQYRGEPAAAARWWPPPASAGCSQLVRLHQQLRKLIRGICTANQFSDFTRLACIAHPSNILTKLRVFRLTEGDGFTQRFRFARQTKHAFCKTV
jgi:hypothetical protein